jgi:hypothetical protein
VPTTVVPEPTGVPGLTADDPFCSAWAGYAGTLQALGIAASFGQLSSDQFAALELVASSRIVEVAAAIEAAWPAELAAEHDVVIDNESGRTPSRTERRCCPHDRRRHDRRTGRPQRGLAGRARGATRRSRSSPCRPCSDLQTKVDGRRRFDADVTRSPRTPAWRSTMSRPADRRVPRRPLPDLASSGVGDAL